MHFSSLENMRRCIDWYFPVEARVVIDLGASDVNGSYRKLLPSDIRYIGMDLESGPGVDVVMEDPYVIPLGNEEADLVLSGQMLEHCEHFWRIFTEIGRVLRPGGLAFIIAPSAGPIHRYPVDCYRFYPDAYKALARWAGLRLVHCWMDERGPWHDLVGVFQKGGALKAVTGPQEMACERQCDDRPADAEAEAVQGGLGYLQVLASLHKLLKPQLYTEIGVRKGASLQLCQCEAIAIDPHPEYVPNAAVHRLYRMTSDDFFFFKANSAFEGRGIDLAFIDGMHWVECALRDFMNLEQRMSPAGVIVIDDILPNHHLQARRTRASQVWCGDVWRIVPVLKELRPELRLTLLDTAPTGLLVVSGLNPESRALWDSYNSLVRRLMEQKDIAPPSEVLRRTGAVPADEATLIDTLGITIGR
jgi:predicted O-methyltransferase YrrM